MKFTGLRVMIFLFYFDDEKLRGRKTTNREAEVTPYGLTVETYLDACMHVKSSVLLGCMHACEVKCLTWMHACM